MNDGRKLKRLRQDTEAFVEAADRLVNLLAGPAPTGVSSARMHQQSVDKAYNRYDTARAAIMGDPAEE